VVSSFERNAPPDTKLVFKVHPMDRGYRDYRELLDRLDQRLGGGRILYVDRVSLQVLLNHAVGLVNINSSVGISGLMHHIPVITLGTAVYDLKDLTYQGDLDSFWTEATPPCKKNVRQFINLLLQTNQSYGLLFQRCFDVSGRCKIQWVKPFQEEFFGPFTNP
jgi:capsular polysaccharide export protein